MTIFQTEITSSLSDKSLENGIFIYVHFLIEMANLANLHEKKSCYVDSLFFPPSSFGARLLLIRPTIEDFWAIKWLFFSLCMVVPLWLTASLKSSLPNKTAAFKCNFASSFVAKGKKIAPSLPSDSMTEWCLPLRNLFLYRRIFFLLTSLILV